MEVNRFADMGIGMLAGGKIKEFYGDGSDGVFDTSNMPMIESITVAQGETVPCNNINYLIDNDPATVYNTTKTSTINNAEVIFKMTFDKPVLMTSLKLLQTRLGSSSGSIRLQSSVDNINWYDISGNIGITSVATDITVTINQNYTQNIAKYYRFIAASSISSSVKLYISGLSQYSTVMPNPTIISADDKGKFDLVVKQYESIHIAVGHTLTTVNPCQGLVLYSKGDVIIDGAIDMSKKGGMSPTFIDILRLGSSPDKMLAINKEVNGLKGGAGGNGGNSEHYYSAYATIYGGVGGKGRKFLGGFGGGGAGAGGYYVQGGKGGGITNDYNVSGFQTPGVMQTGYNGSSTTPNDGRHGSGGCGGAMHHADTMSTAATGGVGGGGGGAGGGGGGGALVYVGGSSENGGGGGDGEYAGGFILIIAKGNIIINGQIKADGGKGGNGGYCQVDSQGYVNGAGGGAGAGGGVVALLYKGTLTNNGTISAYGGAGGSGSAGVGTSSPKVGTAGTSGSVGTIYTRKID